MRYRGNIFILFALFLSASAYGQDGIQKYVGGSGCRPEFRRAPGTYGIRLDKTQRAHLQAHTVNDQNILLIIQYADDHDQCGIVRDAVQPEDPSSGFIFNECTDSKNLSAVVIGTWPASDRRVLGLAVQAWQINLKQLKFIRLTTPVSCYLKSGAGPDDGKDLAIYARERAARKTKSAPKQ